MTKSHVLVPAKLVTHLSEVKMNYKTLMGVIIQNTNVSNFC